jgi:hypothetical protein
MDPQRPCWRVLVCVRWRPGRSQLGTARGAPLVSEAHQVAVPRGLKVQAPETDFESGGEGV